MAIETVKRRQSQKHESPNEESHSFKEIHQEYPPDERYSSGGIDELFKP
jgi:hypothetical protein